MNMREEIVSKVQRLSDGSLIEVYDFVERIEAKERKPSLMERLRQIKIDAPPDFSRNIDLYMSGEKKIDSRFD